MSARKPNAIKELEGNQGKRPLPEEPPTEPVRTYLSPPKQLAGAAKETWKTTLPTLIEMGVIAQSDLKSFLQYCIICGAASDAYDDVKKNGLILKQKNIKGDMLTKKNPAADILKEMTAQARIFAVEFGLTPASRSKAGYSKPPVTPDVGKKNKFTH